VYNPLSSSISVCHFANHSSLASGRICKKDCKGDYLGRAGMTKGRRVGRYELLEDVAQGEILTIYRARDTERDRPVIVKMVHTSPQEDSELVARFRRRSEELLSLRHPNISPVLDASFGPEALYLVASIPEGESLDQRCARHGPLEVDDVLSIISQVAEALDYAHGHEVLHHDIRPANVFLHNKTVMLTDFFVLEAVGASPVYMAPEQLDETSGQATDQRSDAYAVGVIVYKMLTGRPPFEGTAADVAAAHLTQRPLAPRVHNPDLFPAVDAILLKALAKQPQSRYQSAGELVTALHEAVQTAQTRRIAEVGVFGDPVRIAREAARRTQSSPSAEGIPTWIWVGLGILLIVVITVVILLVTS
jgi:serine/threonine-protein kinase